jgi:hypothetical protein
MPMAASAQGPGAIRINEVLANNASLTNVGAVVTAWVELVNTTSAPVALSDTSVTDNLSDPRRFVFPAGATIPGNGLLVVRFDPLAARSAFNTGFGLKTGGGGLYLYDRPANGGALIDSIEYGIQAADFSIGRASSGGGGWVLNVPTPGATNIAATLGLPTALKINEWMAVRSGNAEDWFEIFNSGPLPVSLGGLYLTDDPATRNRFGIANLSFIGIGLRGGYALFLADNQVSAGADHVNFRLEGSGEFIGLFDTDLAPIDTLKFGSQRNNVSEGRLPDGSTNRVFFIYSPSPGAPNQILAALTNVVINEILAHTDPPLEDAVELQNVTDAPIDIGGWYLSDELNDLRRYRIPGNTVIPAHGYTVIYEGQFNAVGVDNPARPFTYNSAHGDEAFLTQSDRSGALLAFTRQAFGSSFNGVSFGRYVTSDGVDFVAMSARSFGQDNPGSILQFRRGIGLPNPSPRVGPLVINEIMYHPPDLGGADNNLDEFIEIRNLTRQRFPLFDPRYPTNHWRLRGAVDFDFPSQTWLGPDGILLVVSFDSVLNTAALADFRLRYGLSNSVPIFGPYLGELDNSGESVELVQPDAVQQRPHSDAGYVPYVLVDRVKYNDSAPWPPEADGAGYSLQRKNRRLYGDDPANWKAAVPTAGRPNGTPPAIVAQPQTQTYLAGSDTTFTVGASGAPPLSYQWRFKGVDLPGATNATLAILGMDASDVGGYSVVVSNDEESIPSTEALLRIDPKSPTLRITSPRPNARLSNAVLTVQGSAQDNFGVSQVLVSLNEGLFQPAQGTTNWSVALELAAGTNTIRAKAVDHALNESSLVTLRVFFVVNSPLAILVSGDGSVSPTLDGTMLEVGRGYSLRASPAPGSLLSNWTGTGASGPLSSVETTLSFIMQSNLVLQAAFVPNRFVTVRGSYNGLFFEADEVRHERSGFFTATITELGTYSASLQIGTSRFPFSGRFDLSALATNRVALAATESVTVEMTLNLDEGGARITGHIRGGVWTANLAADRAAFSASTNPAPYLGAYTWVVSSSNDPATGPGGDGFGTVRVDASGRITFLGILGDGTKATQKVPISQNGDWPLYVGLYGGKGSLLGWTSVTNHEDGDLNGILSWSKAAAAGKLYANGFTNNATLTGSRYTRPNSGRVLNLINGFVTFTGGDLSAPFTNHVTLTEDNRFANLSTNKLTLSITPATGLFAGTGTDPVTGKSIPFKGAVLRKQNRASGHFLGPTQSGRVSVDP